MAAPEPQPDTDLLRLLAAWRAAEADLALPNQATLVEGAVLVPDFGARGGMLCLLMDDVTAKATIAARRPDQGYSCLNPSTYLTYSREEYVDMLNDWGWTGEGAPPAWYTGEPWS